MNLWRRVDSAPRTEVRGCFRGGTVWIRRFGLTVRGFGREIALLGFNAVQQLGVDIDCDQFWSVLIAAGGGYVPSRNCPAKSYYFPATREAGLVQIANVLIEQLWDPKRPDSDCRPSHGLNGSYVLTRTPTTLSRSRPRGS